MTAESEVRMEEKTIRRKLFEDRIPSEVRQHVRAAREEMRESLKAFLPPAFIEHRRKARKEMLLAWRSLIDATLERMEEKEEMV